MGAETSCLTPGLRLSSANGQSNPSVDSITIMGAGGKVFSSALRRWKDGMQTRNIKPVRYCNLYDVQLNIQKYVYYYFTKHTKHITLSLSQNTQSPSLSLSSLTPPFPPLLTHFFTFQRSESQEEFWTLSAYTCGFQSIDLRQHFLPICIMQ